MKVVATQVSNQSNRSVSGQREKTVFAKPKNGMNNTHFLVGFKCAVFQWHIIQRKSMSYLCLERLITIADSPLSKLRLNSATEGI